jgi:mannosylglycerate hydrolase MGH1-like protein/glycosyl hydrolase family 63
LEQSRSGVPWKKWGPYVSERQWGTVREDYSESGDAWNYFTHDHARSRAYRWGEDGIGGISDDHQRLCFALALWNERDPILKERLFGLTNSEGNHGEDVKEYYFYLDNTPTHSFMRELYKYPQAAFPYNDLIETNRSRGRADFEYELLDTGVFDEDRYFDVFIEYAKAAPEDLLIEVTAHNRGPESAPLHVLPTLWFRNTWEHLGSPRPVLRQGESLANAGTVAARDSDLGEMHLYFEGDVPLLVTENETNNERLFGRTNQTPYVKDGINDYVVDGNVNAVNPEHTGTKASPHYRFEIGPGETARVRLRLTRTPPAELTEPFSVAFDEEFSARRREADEFYVSVTPPEASEDQARIVRQALAGMLWSKQYYAYDVTRWLMDRDAHPRRPHRSSRNQEWSHMYNEDIISMPDKWEYPWFAAWDLAFHTIPLATVDVDFAQDQLDLMLREDYLHPNGQLPAYEWNFSDVNPPVHAWASLFAYETEKRQRGTSDVDFLKRIFHKLLANFTWWVNRKDRFGHNVFEGGFLGLDNIGVFDRSAPLPTGGYLEQADGTAWMAMFTQNMLSIAIELAAHDAVFDDMAPKFADHFLLIASAINRTDPGEGLWDEEDGFYYDRLRRPDGSSVALKTRSVVGLLPLCATTVIEGYQRDHMPRLVEHVQNRRKQLESYGVQPELERITPGYAGRILVSLVSRDRLVRILKYVLDEDEFFSPYGIRSLSHYHADHPYKFSANGDSFGVGYLPAESDSGMFGGNSNWRGPIWFPINALIIRALLTDYLYYGNDLKVECPTGSGHMMTLYEVAEEIARRLSRIFLRDDQGRRPVYGGTRKFQEARHWRDHLLFHEYFHGDNGAGLGASHQTGWTGLIASGIQLFGTLNAEAFLESGQIGAPRQQAEEVSVRHG